VRCEDEAATRALAADFARCLIERGAFDKGAVIALEGDLGTGKTFFARSLIQTLAPGVRVKSPTYTLHERYDTPHGPVYHWDLYRLCDAEELAYLGLRDLLQPPCLHLVEWPEKGAGVLPVPDGTVAGQVCGETCREFDIQVGTLFE